MTCCVSLVLLSTQGSASLRAEDVAGMVNHRDKVGYSGIVVEQDADQKAGPRSNSICSSDLVEISQSSDSWPLARARCIAYCGLQRTRTVLLD